MKALLLLALLATTAHAGATVYLPAEGPALTHVGQRFNVPVIVSGFDNPTGQGGKHVEVNVLPSAGLTIETNLLIGPWVISGNPVSFFGVHGTYLDLFHLVAGAISPAPPCITDTGGVAFSLRILVNSDWLGGHETLRLGRSIKETGPEPRLLDCGDALVPIAYGNKTCVFAPAVLAVGPTAARPETEWYDLAGRRLAVKPSRSGVFIRRDAGHPRKVVVVK